MNEYNACFISYRHPDDPNAKKFIREFVAVLKTQLQINLPNARIFFDEDGLKVGDTLEKLALELCRSACLVIFYGPRHFDPTYPYCTMEYLGMRRLEVQRRRQLATYLDHNSLIFPVVFRGSESLPQEIKGSIYADFDDVMQPTAFRSGERRKKIDTLARQIYRRWDELERAGIFADHDCSTFRLPQQDVQDWLDQNLKPGRTPMPNR
jgi:hypothetical protein